MKRPREVKGKKRDQRERKIKGSERDQRPQRPGRGGITQLIQSGCGHCRLFSTHTMKA